MALTTIETINSDETVWDFHNESRFKQISSLDWIFCIL